MTEKEELKYLFSSYSLFETDEERKAAREQNEWRPEVLKRPPMGKYWHYTSGYEPSMQPEEINDVDIRRNPNPLDEEPNPISNRQKRDQPRSKERLEPVICLFLMAYNTEDPSYYQYAGEYMAATLEYTLMPRDEDVRYAKLRELINDINRYNNDEVVSWCIREFPYTMEYLASEGKEPFCQGFISGYDRRWIRIKRKNPVVSKIVVA